MKTLSDVVTLAAIAATLLIVSAAPAICQQGHGDMPSHGAQPQGATPPHQHDMMEMSAMHQEPHHVLAMAYRDNLVSFARALQHQAGQAKTVDPEFARAAVAEMKRSFNQMEQHHQDHMKTMDDTMKAGMADTMKQMDAHNAAIKEHLAELDHDVHTSAPDATSVSQHVAEILKHCNGMSKMHAGTMDHKMAGPKDPMKN
jgi:leucyl aminopeptidase (aminopeptidase T)